MIALASGKAEQPFLQDRIMAIPDSKGKAHRLVAVTNSREAVFSPAISAGTRVIMRKVVPSGTSRTVVFPDRSPLTLADIRTPPLPVNFPLARFLESLFLDRHGTRLFLYLLQERSKIGFAAGA